MLGDICQIAMGQSPSSDTYTMNKAGVPFFQGNADFGEENPIPRIWCNKPIKIANENDILISVRAPIGSINIANRKCCIGRGLAKITPNTCVYLRYLIWFLRSRTKFLQDNGTGTTFKAINKKQLETLPISLPNVNEQMQIGQVLDKLSSLINLKKKQYRVLDKLVKSQFIELKHNKKQKITLLKNVCKIGSAKRVYHHELRSVGEVPFFKVSDIVQLSNSISPSKKQFLSNETYNELVLEHAIPLPEDILITTRGTIGVSYKMKVNDKFYFQDGMVSWIRVLDKSLISEFLSAYLQFEQCKLQMNKQSGSTVGYLSLKDLSNIQISYPDKLEQEKFICFKHAVDKSKFVVQQSIEKLELLKKSLMQQYFG